MARVRKGTKSLGGGKVMVRTGTTMGIRKIRCMSCKTLVGPSQGSDSKPIYKCTCGRSFRVTTM